ncbi:MAG TPA: hypothetical protein VKW04_24350 [Planctomycetota bacterium]|nr:hypothetical protein [Planctomycetota bacterium]
MGRLLVAVAMAGLFSQPVYADIIPTRRAGDSAESSRKVESRLVQLGVSSEAAKDQIQKLTDDQTTYFAGNPERIQLVGQENWGGQSDNLWWEWVFGILALVAVGGFIVWKAGQP